MKYPKINTLWKRDEKNKFNIIEGDFSCPEFASICKWHITEKIDGTNIRVIWNSQREDSPTFLGRTDEAQIPPFLLDKLKEIFTREKLLKHFPDSELVVLYGEGYGNKIQSVGKKYRKDNSFIIFDANIGGWWLEPHNVKDIAIKLNIDYVPELGIRTNKEIISLVKGSFRSSLAEDNLNAEGIVARSHPLMLFRDGSPIMWKLKTKDYVKLNAHKK